MDARVLMAAENNAAWCDLVCRSLGIPTGTDERVWAASRRAPELYPDAVTLRPDAGPQEVLGSIEDGPGCSVKDSFATLDLAPYGFTVLFEARWFHREPETGSRDAALRWRVIYTDEQLSRCAGLPHRLLGPILRDPDVRIVASADMTAAAVVNRSGSVVGVSNVCGVWDGLPDVIARLFPGSPIVGYERGVALTAALAAGFQPTGPLRVWINQSA